MLTTPTFPFNNIATNNNISYLCCEQYFIRQIPKLVINTHRDKTLHLHPT